MFSLTSVVLCYCDGVSSGWKWTAGGKKTKSKNQSRDTPSGAHDVIERAKSEKGKKYKGEKWSLPMAVRKGTPSRQLNIEKLPLKEKVIAPHYPLRKKRGKNRDFKDLPRSI